MDYEALFARLAQAIIDNDGKLDGDNQAFISRLLDKLKAEGYVLQGDAQSVLTDYLDGINGSIKTAIADAATIAAGGTLIAGALQSQAALAAAERAFTARWPDGLTLSKRLWQWRTDTRLSVTQTLQAGVRHGSAVNKVIYDMQRAIERSTGERFAVVSSNKAKWVDALAQAGKLLIADPAAKKQWADVVAKAEATIDQLAVGSTRRDAEQLLGQIRLATEKGRVGLIDKAVRWKIYGKQLYNLKRIARTEMATAAHQGVIASTEDDDAIIGYQWRLSSSHPVADICDYYANIEMGLGRGVWTKDTVPHEKAHPHCMCLLIPRVTPIKQKGSENYADFVQSTSPERREQMLPKWAKDAVATGVPLARLTQKGNRGLMAKRDAQPIINTVAVEQMVAQFAEMAKNANAMADLWGTAQAFGAHVARRQALGHVTDGDDYRAKIDATLRNATGFKLATGKADGLPSVELTDGGWSVILKHNGTIKTAYEIDQNKESFDSIQTRLGYKVYEHKIDNELRGILKSLPDLR
jgi:hypothetical protein